MRNEDWIALADQARIEGPHGWIQWKGTNVCMDVHCACGYHGHVDTDFFYGYECVGCGKRWIVGSYVKLIEATPEVAAQDWPHWQKTDHVDEDHEPLRPIESGEK